MKTLFKLFTVFCLLSFFNTAVVKACSPVGDIDMIGQTSLFVSLDWDDVPGAVSYTVSVYAGGVFLYSDNDTDSDYRLSKQVLEDYPENLIRVSVVTECSTIIGAQSSKGRDWLVMAVEIIYDQCNDYFVPVNDRFANRTNYNLYYTRGTISSRVSKRSFSSTCFCTFVDHMIDLYIIENNYPFWINPVTVRNEFYRPDFYNNQFQTITGFYGGTGCNPPAHKHDDENANISIYPNPFVSELQIDGLEVENAIVNIFDTTGRLAFSMQTDGTQTSVLVPATLPEGVYIVEVTKDGEMLASQTLMKL